MRSMVRPQVLHTGGTSAGRPCYTPAGLPLVALLHPGRTSLVALLHPGRTSSGRQPLKEMASMPVLAWRGKPLLGSSHYLLNDMAVFIKSADRTAFISEPAGSGWPTMALAGNIPAAGRRSLMCLPLNPTWQGIIIRF